MDGEVIVASVSALIAAGALLYAIHDSRRRATFEMLRVVEERAAAIYGKDHQQMYEDVRKHYLRESDDLSHSGIAYLRLLNALELVATMREQGGLNNDIADAYVVSLAHMATPDYLADIQECCKDPKVYADLRKYMLDLKYNYRLTFN